jgi:PrtD family type I secretion system ABC transporter
MRPSKNSLSVALDATRPALASVLWLSVIINITLFTSPIYSLQVYDRVMASRNMGTLVFITAIVVVFLALYGILEYARNGILQRTARQFSHNISGPAFDLAVRAQLLRGATASQQVLKDAETLREGLSSSLIPALFDVPWAPFFVLVCMAINPLLGFVALAGAIAIFTCAILSERLANRCQAESSTKIVDAQRSATSGLRNAEIARALGMSDILRERWLADSDALIGTQQRAAEQAALLMAITKVIRLSVQIALLGTGAWLAIQGIISPGVILAASIIMARALAPVEHVVANLKRLTMARAALKRLHEAFEAMPEPHAAVELPHPKGYLSVEGVELKHRATEKAAVDGASFAIEPGTSLAIVGPSGSGKSSLIRALAGLMMPTAGAVRLDGAALCDWDPAQLGRAIGYVSQDIEFFAGTIAQNIARLQQAKDADIVDAAQQAGVHEAILRLPQGYQTMLGDGVVALSAGMRQRVALARALFGRPAVVLLDEANSNLDMDGDAALARAMSHMRRNGQTVVAITHKPQLLAHVDKILVLVNGRVHLFGDRNAVLSKLGPMSTAAQAAVNNGLKIVAAE